MYKKTKCAVKIENKITDFFDYTKGVSPLSPLLFNLYVNDIFDVIDQLTTSPIQLYDNKCLHVLMYADDLNNRIRKRTTIKA